jgi:hypothetical protein
VALQHAEDDARRVRDVFVELGGVEPGRAVVLTRPTATQVREKFAEVTGRVVELKASAMGSLLGSTSWRPQSTARAALHDDLSWQC